MHENNDWNLVEAVVDGLLATNPGATAIPSASVGRWRQSAFRSEPRPLGFATPSRRALAFSR